VAEYEAENGPISEQALAAARAALERDGVIPRR